MRLLVTGSEGLIGSALLPRLRAAGHDVTVLDTAALVPADVTDYPAVHAAMTGCDGVLHLAAVSRVIFGERNPAWCRTVNIGGTRNVLRAARHHRAWVIAASSREVYGQARHFPVRESALHRPLNAYARSKVAMERSVRDAADDGLRASVIRFSSVYGSAADHPTRVANAFARAAAEGGTLVVEGEETTLDLTHIDDVAGALVLAVTAAAERPLPDLHLVSGRGVTLPELAVIACTAAGAGMISAAPPRPYDVTAFTGDPALAGRVLGWLATTPVEDGMARLVSDFREVSSHVREGDVR